MPQITYSILRNRLSDSVREGMKLNRGGTGLTLMDRPIRRLYLPPIDSAKEGSGWGRFSFKADITDEMVLYVYAFASDLDTLYDESGSRKIFDMLKGDDPDEEKKRIFKSDTARRFVGKEDMLLYDLFGRYLFFCIEVIGEGEGSLSKLRVQLHGDQFMDTFPAVYRERGSFLHRFLSIFSSIYNDFDDVIASLPNLLDPDEAPAEMLPVYARWLGIDLSGDFLSEETMRTFVREGYNLNRMKGTKACLERVIEIVLGERAIILEHNTINSYYEKGDMEFSGLEKKSIYDVSILIRKNISETDRHQLLYLLRQFVPLRSRLHLVRLKDSGALDTDVYMDMNAIIAEESYGVLDDEMEMDDDIVLE